MHTMSSLVGRSLFSQSVMKRSCRRIIDETLPQVTHDDPPAVVSRRSVDKPNRTNRTILTITRLIGATETNTVQTTELHGDKLCPHPHPVPDTLVKNRNFCHKSISNTHTQASTIRNNINSVSQSSSWSDKAVCSVRHEAMREDYKPIDRLGIIESITITAVLPLSPLPCSSLAQTPDIGRQWLRFWTWIELTEYWRFCFSFSFIHCVSKRRYSSKL